MNRIKSQILQTIRQYNMVCSGETLTVAFSGGADSAALLVLLDGLRDELGIELQAAHLNHGLRGEESLRDANFAKAFCQKRGIPFCTESVEIEKRPGESTEEAARRIRYAFLRKVAGEGKIATAHNADDNAETVLLNLIRGSGIRGLCGIPPVNGPIIRPLIGVDGETIRDFCRENSIDYVVDSTNLTDDYSRNRLRHHVLPVLKSLNPALCETVTRQSELLRQDADCLDALAATDAPADALDGKSLSTLHPAICSRVLRNYAESRGVTLDHHHTHVLMDLVEMGAGRRELPGGYTAELLKNRLTVHKDTAPEGFVKDFSTLSATVHGRQITGRRVPKAKIHNLLLKNGLDCATIGDDLTVRSRLPGDDFTPLGRGCRKTLHKLFNEAGVPAAQRDRLLILTDERGILWVEGFGVDERAAVTENTDTVLVLDISNSTTNATEE